MISQILLLLLQLSLICGSTRSMELILTYKYLDSTYIQKNNKIVNNMAGTD